MYMMIYQLIIKNKINLKECVYIDPIGLCPWYILKKYIIASSTYSFIMGKLLSKQNEHIKEIITDSRAFKKEVGTNEIIYNKI